MSALRELRDGTVGCAAYLLLVVVMAAGGWLLQAAGRWASDLIWGPLSIR